MSDIESSNLEMLREAYNSAVARLNTAQENNSAVGMREWAEAVSRIADAISRSEAIGIA